MKFPTRPTQLGFLFGLLLTVATFACSSGTCGPIELWPGEYKVKFSRWFDESPPMEKGTLLYEPEIGQVTIFYDSAEGPATVVLRAAPAEPAP